VRDSQGGVLPGTTVATDALSLSYAIKLAPLDGEIQLKGWSGVSDRLGSDAKCSREWLEPIGRLRTIESFTCGV
jgi:hypothetical protein